MRGCEGRAGGRGARVIGAVAISAVMLGTPMLLAQGTGSITGTISTTAKALRPVRVTIDQKVCGTELPDDAIIVDPQGHLANAVVVLTGVKARSAAAEAVVTNDQCRFAPRVQVARPNATIRTTSKDTLLHTTHAQSETGDTMFNVALPFPGINITKPIGAAGIVHLICNIHPWMRGWVMVTDEMAAVSSANGRFTHTDVPPGSYELHIWHETLTSAPQRVTVAAGRVTDVAIAMK